MDSCLWGIDVLQLIQLTESKSDGKKERKKSELAMEVNLWLEAFQDFETCQALMIKSAD